MDEAVPAIEDCLADITTSIENNLLKLYQNKTELTVLYSKLNVKIEYGNPWNRLS